MVLAVEADSECQGSPVRMHAANGLQPGASGRVVASAAADHMQSRHVDVGDVRGAAGAEANRAGRRVIDPGRLLADLTRLRADLEADLHERCEENSELDAFLRDEHEQAVARERTASPYAAWRDDRLTQVAVAWILGCVFVRFLEDNTLVNPPRLSGPGERRQRALDEHTLYFRERPTDSDREYLVHVFRAVAALPIAGQIFDKWHNPVWLLPEGCSRSLWRRRGSLAPLVAADRTGLRSPDTRFHRSGVGHALPG